MEQEPECGNCQGENARTGYVELWDGVCPDCGRKVEEVEQHSEAAQ